MRLSDERNQGRLGVAVDNDVGHALADEGLRAWVGQSQTAGNLQRSDTGFGAVRIPSAVLLTPCHGIPYDHGTMRLHYNDQPASKMNRESNGVVLEWVQCPQRTPRLSHY